MIYTNTYTCTNIYMYYDRSNHTSDTSEKPNMISFFKIQTFITPSMMRLLIKFAFDWPRGFREGL